MAVDPGVETLLEHAAFVRRLALQLAGEGQADDVVQDTFVRAVQAPPESDQSPRGWLRTVATNVWRNRRREAVRRAQRELLAKPAAAVPPVDEIVAREEMRRRVVAAVLALPEPLRDVVLLRFYEGLDSPAIARRLDRPASTVRTQLQTACERLRRRLDDDHDGRRAAWATPLLAWARPHAVPSSMPVLLRVLGVAGALVAVAAVLVMVWPEAVPPPAVAANASLAPPPPTATVSDPRRDWVVTPGTRLDAAAAAPGAYEDRTPSGSLHLATIDEQTTMVAAGATLRIAAARARASTLVGLPPAEFTTVVAVTDEQGRAVVREMPAGLYEIEAALPDGRAARREVAVGAGERKITLALATEAYLGVVAVKVVDRSGHAVADAAVALACHCTRRGLVGDQSSPAIEGRTDASGLLVIRDPARIEYISEGVVVVRTADGRCGLARIDRPEHRGHNPWFEVVVDVPGAIAGRLSGPRQDWTGVSVTALAAWTYDGVRPDCTVGNFALRVAADGSFTGEGLPAGRYHLAIAGAGQLVDRACAAVDSWQFLPVTKVLAGATSHQDLVLDTAPGVLGVVLDADGAPVADAVVTALRVAADRPRAVWHPRAQDPPSPTTWLVATTNAAGRYELALRPGHWVVTATANRRHLDAQPIEVVLATEPPTLTHRLLADGALRGRAALEVIALRRLDRDGEHAVLHQLATVDGAFAVRGLAPGPWEIGFVEDAFTAIGRVEIQAGQTAYFDPSAGASTTVRGSVHVDGQPVAGIGVDTDDAESRVLTDATGTFVLPVPAGVAAPRLCFTHRGLDVGTRPLGPERELGVIDLPLRRLDLEVLRPAGLPRGFTFELTKLSGDRDRRVKEFAPDGRIEGQLLLVGHGHYFEVRSLDGFRIQQQIAAGTGPLRLRLDAGATSELIVRLVDGHGAVRIGGALQAVAWGQPGPAPGDGATFWRQRATDSNWASRYAVNAQTDADGVARFAGLPPGPVLVWYAGEWSSFGYENGPLRRGAPPAECVVTLEPGATRTIDLALPR